MHYTHVLFDVDGTLLDFDQAQQSAFHMTFAQFGHCSTQKDLRSYDAINVALWKQLERGEITRERLTFERFARILTEMKLSFDPAAFQHAYLENLAEGAALIDGARETLQTLHGHCLLAVVTNGVAVSQRRRLAKSGLYGLFDAIVISEEIGFDKPDIRFFRQALHMCGDPAASRVVLVGDSLTADIAGGATAGLDTCWFNPRGLALTGHNIPTYTIQHLSQVPHIAAGKEQVWQIQ
ncbi:MAG: YjjG family noncanonical pyrimidine nucleotidase [Oscillospiraceae bacterium]